MQCGDIVKHKIKILVAVVVALVGETDMNTKIVVCDIK